MEGDQCSPSPFRWMLLEMNRTLIVDDESDVLNLMRIYLEAVGHEVETAENGEQALQKIDEFKPDLVLLDIILPGITGFEVLRQIRDNPKTSPLKVVIFTALGSEVENMLGAGIKANGYLGKPFSKEQLYSVLDKAMGEG